MILDDGGDATLLVHKGVEFEKAGAVPEHRPRTTPRSTRVILDLLRALARSRPDRSGRAMAAGIKGVTEETTTGVHRLYQLRQGRRAAVPGDQRQRLGHQEQVRQQVRHAGTR